MRLRTLLLMPALAAAALGIGASSAAASPTLFTTASYTSRVPVGTTMTMGLASALKLTSGTSTINSCLGSNLTLTLDTNNDTAGVVATVGTGTSFSNCTNAMSATTAVPWVLSVTGTSSMGGGFITWGASLTSVSFDMLGGLYTGSFTSEFVTQPGAGTPACLHLRFSGTFSGPLTSAGRMHGVYCFTGTAAAYSFQN